MVLYNLVHASPALHVKKKDGSRSEFQFLRKPLL